MVRSSSNTVSDHLSGVFPVANTRYSQQEDEHQFETVGPLRVWSLTIAQLTNISASQDIAAPYSALMNHLDTFQFKNKMRAEASLWLQDEPMSVDVAY